MAVPDASGIFHILAYEIAAFGIYPNVAISVLCLHRGKAIDHHTSHQVKYVVEANKPATVSDPVTERLIA